ncbi:hypothetical protein PSHT_13495 [Puccinia striiformis]|uniref:Myb/SANT-like domain-containing protein n=2 Tax=Puccinia striiformis TaxID=27350 RepID=A0A2S4UQJ2_9BASI|nr:hypothetical protein PSHT_13495 [Puccinia striiformis]
MFYSSCINHDKPMKGFPDEAKTEPDEIDIEALTLLFLSVGKPLDSHTKGKRTSSDFQELLRSPYLSSRAQLMIQNIIDARRNGWVGCEVICATTILEGVANYDPTNEENIRPVSSIAGSSQPQKFDAWTEDHLWTGEQRRTLLQFILDQHHLGYTIDNLNAGDLKMQGWLNLTMKMRRHFHTYVALGWMRDQFNFIRQSFIDINVLIDRFGLGLDPQRSTLIADLPTWRQLLKVAFPPQQVFKDETEEEERSEHDVPSLTGKTAESNNGNAEVSGTEKTNQLCANKRNIAEMMVGSHDDDDDEDDDDYDSSWLPSSPSPVSQKRARQFDVLEY